jgi:hypothetical protein
MWFYIQMALPLLTVGLAAAICFGVVSYQRPDTLMQDHIARIDENLLLRTAGS